MSDGMHTADTTRRRIHRMLYSLLLWVGVVSMTTSNYVMNMAWVFLLVNWLVEGDMRRKFATFGRQYLLQAWMVLMAVHLVAMLWSSDAAYGWDDIRKKLPLLVVPLVVLTSQRLSDRRYRALLFSYVVTLAVVCVIGLVRLATIDSLPYREIVPFISHIRFALNLCLGITLLGWQVVRTRSWWIRLVASLLAMGFTAYLLLLQSYTGLVILAMVSVALLAFYWRGIAQQRLRNGIVAGVGALALGLVCAVGVNVYHYFHLQPLSTEPLRTQTVNGNAYTHQQDGFIENGNYVNNYICEEELRREWAKRSDFDLDSITAVGYPAYPALVRYLNAMGLTKDSVGVAQLTERDIAAIEQGIANPVYLKTISLKRMCYTMCYEWESHRRYHSVVNFTMLQRFELWRNGWAVFLQHPLFGTGTGDVVDECHARLAATASPLAGTSKHVHNQYLTLLITFGVVGFGVIAYAFGRAYKRQRLLHNAPMVVMTVIVLMSCLTEDTLETLAGVMFVALFTSLFATHSLRAKK